MGRSVNYLNNAEVVIYFTSESLNGYDDEGNYNEDEARMNWEDFIWNLTDKIKDKLKSYIDVEKWDNNETKIILQNSLCNIGISEYMELYSLSVAPIINDYKNLERLAIKHAKQIENILIKCLADCGVKVLRKVGTFSNGNCIYENFNK